MKAKRDFTDFDTVSQVLEQIGNERQWKKEEIANDVDILRRNRVYRVNDLKALSNESWTQIALLPLVKDLLRSFISSTTLENSKKGNSNSKKKDKKSKEEKMKGLASLSTLGTPVVPTVIKQSLPPLIEQEEEEIISQDQLTLQNTIFNGVAISSLTEEEEGIAPNVENNSRRKSVSFSNETVIGVAASEKKKEKKKKKKNKEKNKDKAMSNNCSEYLNFKSHPYNGTYPIIKLRKMKMKHCRHLPPVPANDPFLQEIHDKLTMASTN